MSKLRSPEFAVRACWLTHAAASLGITAGWLSDFESSTDCETALPPPRLSTEFSRLQEAAHDFLTPAELESHLDDAAAANGWRRLRSRGAAIRNWSPRWPHHNPTPAATPDFIRSAESWRPQPTNRPTRQPLGSYLLEILPERAVDISASISNPIGCVKLYPERSIAGKNFLDPQRRDRQAEGNARRPRRKYFQSSAGLAEH